jgi:hypothetical protein
MTGTVWSLCISEERGVVSILEPGSGYTEVFFLWFTIYGKPQKTEHIMMVSQLTMAQGNGSTVEIFHETTSGEITALVTP